MSKYINMNDINEIKQLCSYINENNLKININEEIEDLKSTLNYVIEKAKEKGTNCLEIIYNTNYTYTKIIDDINKETVLKEIDEARADEKGIKSIKLNGNNISEEFDKIKEEYFTEAYIELYKEYNEKTLKDIEKNLKSKFGFEITNNDNLLNFEMGGAKAGSEPCGYNLYLSRGYIVFEAEDNSTIDNVYTLDNVAELVDLIKELDDMSADAQEDV